MDVNHETLSMKMMIYIALNKTSLTHQITKKNQVTKTRKNIKLLFNFVYPNAQNKTKKKSSYIYNKQKMEVFVQFSDLVVGFGIPRIFLSR